MNPSSLVTAVFLCYNMHRARKLSGTNDVDLRRLGTAGPFVDDSITGRGVVLGRAATKLRSIETHPLTGGSTYQNFHSVADSYYWGVLGS